MDEITKAKIELYSKLLSKVKSESEDDISDSDVDIMYLLSKDKEVQKFLKEKIDHGRSLRGG